MRNAIMACKTEDVKCENQQECRGPECPIARFHSDFEPKSTATPTPWREARKCDEESPKKTGPERLGSGPAKADDVSRSMLVPITVVVPTLVLILGIAVMRLSDVMFAVVGLIILRL